MRMVCFVGDAPSIPESCHAAPTGTGSSDHDVGTGLLALVVLRCALDRRYPALATLHPDLGFGLQLEGRVVQSSDPDLDEPVAAIGCVEEPGPTARAEAATVVARDLAAQLERLDRPLRIHGERAPGLLSAIRAVAAP